MVAAPGRVSTMTGWPQFSVNFCPMTRARMSVDPPGANGTMILIGFSGYLSASRLRAGAAGGEGGRRSKDHCADRATAP